MAEAMKTALPKAESDVAPLEALIREAYKDIDRAVQKNVFHANNGARKKARCAKYKREVLITAGLYKPAPGAPGTSLVARLAAKSAAQ